MEKLVEWIEEDVKEIANIPDVKMIFGLNELKQFNNTTKCWICNEEFDDTADEKGYRKNEKVKDHCHYTGRFRGAAHNSCNLKYKKPNLYLWYFIILVVMIVIYLLKILVLLMVILTASLIMRKNILALLKYCDR